MKKKYVLITGSSRGIGRACAVAFAKNGREVVLTGRDPAPWLQDAADYSTEMRAHKHPYTQGIAAREGVEY